jgi:F-type H+-transporting ATPase subunit epsilon
MEHTFQFELLTPEEVLFRESVQEIIAPGREGYFGIEAGHLYFSTTLKKGVLTIKQNSQTKQYLLSKGIIQVTPQKVVVCAESAVLQE